MMRVSLGLLIAMLVGFVAYLAWKADRLEGERDDALERARSLQNQVHLLESQAQSSEEKLAEAPVSLRAPRTEPPSPAAEESPEEDPAEVARARAEELLGEVRTAYDSMDAEGFLKGCFALLDLGEESHPFLTELINGLDLERLEDIMEKLEGGLATKALLFSGLLARAPALTGVVDFILAREPTSDNASLAALALLTRFQVPVTDSAQRVQEIRALLDVALSPEGGETEAGSQLTYLGIEALAKTGDPAAVAVLEELYGKHPEQYAWKIPRALAGFASEEAVQALARMYESGNDRLSSSVLDSLARMGGDAANQELWSILESEGTPHRKSQIWGSLAARPENLEAMVEALQSESTDANTRRNIIYRLDAGSESETTTLLWDIYQNSAAERNRDVALSRLVHTGDVRAAETAIDLFLSGAATPHAKGSLLQANKDVIQRRSADLVAVASAAQGPLPERLAAARAVARVDRGQAVNALMVGYDGLEEKARIQVTSSLSTYYFGGDDARRTLEGIIEGDRSEKVRQRARQVLRSAR